VEQATWLQTIGYALLDSPVALAAWLLHHDTDSYDKLSRTFLGEQRRGLLESPRLYQRIRQRDRVVSHTVEIAFLDTGARAYLFTFV